ncbi:WD40 repeat-like protein [Delitschia confertaspora ATCC 74209]|uniref:WD40 repeat-like protein n=1 Tax=Delitschia confertaspora ATCC 74209 TaxID=1513339 RepID=A0A9P4JKM1_9PLEO|nr:WD40 repeat-like protein [Delitschia confertaspora ATCC 74209]
MSPILQNECIRVPVTALASIGPLILAAEGPLVRIYDSRRSKLVETKKIFQSQAVHGICVCSRKWQSTVLMIWGGLLVRALEIKTPYPDTDVDELSLNLPLGLRLSPVVKVPDWIFDLTSRPNVSENTDDDTSAWVCAAVTARNALLELTIERPNTSKDKSLKILLAELTAASRCILYSAHVLWSSPDHVLVAAGTAFGEILVWSWMRSTGSEGSIHMHQVLTGHEGSIFGVCISDNLSAPEEKPRRLLASCSDDRTIRIWDLSDSDIATQEDNESSQKRHTGFKAVYEADVEPSNAACLAVGWGHLSRVWSIQFLHSSEDVTHDISGLQLLSMGEDATSRIWKIVPSNTGSGSGRTPFDLKLMDTTAHHSGKNIWASTVFGRSNDLLAATGGADSKITVSPLMISSSGRTHGSLSQEYTVQIISPRGQPSPQQNLEQSVVQKTNPVKATQKSSKNTDFFRCYSFLDASTFFLTTNTGNIFLGYIQPGSLNERQGLSVKTKFLVRLEDLQSHSVCASIPQLGLVFLAGRGSVYVYHKDFSVPSKLCEVQGKVGTVLAATTPDSQKSLLLVSLAGKDSAQMLFVDRSASFVPFISKTVAIPFSDSGAGSSVTSMVYIPNPDNAGHILLGFRRGTVAIYAVPKDADGSHDTGILQASFVRLIEQVHSKESVTAMLWSPSNSVPSTGHLISVGRDGFLAVHNIDFDTQTVALVHNLALPVGTNLEGLYIRKGHLMVYGFQSTKFILHDSTTEEEVMTVECGGAHRSWGFQPHEADFAGTLVWTRASSMQVYSGNSTSHQILRSGGHGREIKAVAISPPMNNSKTGGLVATGAEDTTIKIFKYGNDHTAPTQALDFTCIRTLRKHSTGIQHLQWSDNGEYLFSSGGCEEFYVWRTRILPIIGLGVFCESLCVPSSEHSDLRLMSFDVRTSGSGFVICMAFSDSSLKVYNYYPSAEVKWHLLSSGTYTTSCLTQALLFPSIITPSIALTLGTDGYATSWALPFPISGSPSNDLAPPSALLGWQHRTRLHQSSSKSLASLHINASRTLIVSGGDDGGLGLLLVYSDAEKASPFTRTVIVPRAHASAVSACTLWHMMGKVFLMTSGNDQWVRLWEIVITRTVFNNRVTEMQEGEDFQTLEIRRFSKMKTNVADVSSMAVLEAQEKWAKVVLCGVGMEVVRVEA